MRVTRNMALSAVTAVILTSAITARFRLPSPDTLPRCLDSALVAFETAQSPEEAVSVWKALKHEAPNLAKQQYPDFAFIAAYTFLFFVLAALGRRRPIRSSRIAGTLVIVSAIVTASRMSARMSLRWQISAPYNMGYPRWHGLI